MSIGDILKMLYYKFFVSLLLGYGKVCTFVRV